MSWPPSPGRGWSTIRRTAKLPCGSPRRWRDSNKTAESRQVLQKFIEGLDALPERRPEYVRACVQMSQLVGGEAAPAVPTAAGKEASVPPALEWLNRAVNYAPDSAVALVSRAQFQRRMADLPTTSEQDRSGMRALGP